MTTSTCWNDPRIRSREKSDFVLKFDKLNNPRAMSQKKYNETLQQMGEYGPTCHVQSVYNVCNQKDASGRDVLRLVELKSGKLVIPLEDVFDEIERIHLQHNHLCNIAKFYQAIKESTNLATGNISFEMAKDFISRCQTCTIKSQQKSSKTSQNTGLFAPKLSPTKFPKKNARPEISPILLSNGASNSGGSDGKSDGAKNGSQNGSTNNGQNFKPPSQPSFVAPSPIYTAVNRPFFPTTPLSNQPFSSMTSSSTKDFNYKPGWMPVFTSTPLATKAAQPRIDISSTSFLIPQFTPHQNSNTNQLANNCLVNNRSVITTCGPALQTSNAFTQNTTVIISDHPEVPPIREVVQNAVGNASSREPVIKQEVHSIEEMLQKYIDIGEWKNDFIFTDTECRQILGELARTHFGMWELKESITNPGEFYFFNKKDGTCQWNEPDAWVEEIKKRVSIEKVLRIEQDDENNQLEDEILGEGDIIEQPFEEDNFVVEDPIQRRDENVVQSLEPAKEQQPVVENNIEELIASPTQQDLPQQDMEEIVQSLVDDLITERENQILKQPQSAVVLEEEGKKNVCEGTEGVEETSETAFEGPLDGVLETALDIPVESPSPPPAARATEEPPLNFHPTICSVTTIEKPIEEENNKICEGNVAVNPPILQQQEEEQPVVMNNGGDESTNFLRPFNTTDSFMAAALGGGLNDDTMDIANFIEQFDEQLNSPPPNNRENVQQVLSNEIVIEKVSAEEVNNKNNSNIPPPRPIKYTNQTAKKTIGGGGGGLSFCQFSVTGRKRVNEALKFKPNKEEAKKPPQQQLLSLSSPRKRPPIFKHVALQRVRVSLPDVENCLKNRKWIVVN
uniref:WW domain-containing protein n=1 Tax=Meloidogyne enterolobii TaxID=390850 RepID=A0A6V7UWJ5_MELEN|nr:unnamed protein product [Meloidogyne enterolobii]